MLGSAWPPDVRRWLCPAVDAFHIFGLCPSCGLWPNNPEGMPEQKGPSRGNNLAAAGGHSHRRTSSGEAVPCNTIQLVKGK
jgi:hypothetical protein